MSSSFLNISNGITVLLFKTDFFITFKFFFGIVKAPTTKYCSLEIEILKIYTKCE